MDTHEGVEPELSYLIDPHLMVSEKAAATLTKEMELMVFELVKLRGAHFTLGAGSSGSKICCTDVGRDLMRLVHKLESLCLDYDTSLHYEPNPFCNLILSGARDYFSLYRTLSSSQFPVALEEFARLGNDLVTGIVEGYDELFLGDLRKKMQKVATQRRQGTISYINAQFNKYSKLLVVRLDLAYRKGYFLNRSDVFGDDLSKVKRDWQDLYIALNDGLVPELSGHIVTIEYGVLTGFHLHVLLMFNGSMHSSDIVIAGIIGRHWVKKTTAGKGRYYSCNRYPKKYKHLGIGMIQYHDRQLRFNLIWHVAKYLVKADTVITSRCPGERTFFKGWTPSCEENRGRPRSLSASLT